MRDDDSVSLPVRHPLISALPLFLVYAVYPAAMPAGRYMGFAPPRMWIEGAWLILTGFAVLFCLGAAPRSRAASGRRVHLAGMFLFGLLLVGLVKFGTPLLHSRPWLVPYLQEIKPLVYLLFSVLWAWTFGPPSARSFLGLGVFLAFLVLADLAVSSFQAGVLTRPMGSGEINYDACLLLIPLAAFLGLDPEGRPSWARIAAILIFLGLLATMSRTALAAAALMVLFLSRGRFAGRLVLIGACALFVYLSFVVRELPLMSLERMDRWWMWLAGVELFREYPLALVTGFPAGEPLPVAVPDAIRTLWEFQRQDWGLPGVHPFNFHAFWLRLALTWGVAGLVVVNAALAWVASRGRDRFFQGFVILILVMGMSMGLFYLSNVAVALYLACAMGLAPFREFVFEASAPDGGRDGA